MTMEVAYGPMKNKTNSLLPARMDTSLTLPCDDPNRRSTILIRSRPGDNNTMGMATLRTQHPTDINGGSLSHHRQASVQLQPSEDYVNTATLVQDNDSVQYFVLEKPPDYSGAH